MYSHRGIAFRPPEFTILGQSGKIANELPMGKKVALLPYTRTGYIYMYMEIMYMEIQRFT